MAKKIHRCARCGARLRNPNGAKAEGWIYWLSDGLVSQTLCGACTTPMERASTAANEAMAEVGRMGELIVQRPKFRSPA